MPKANLLFTDDEIKERIFYHFSQWPTSYQVIPMGVMTYKYRFTVDGQDYIIRIYPPSRKDINIKEFEVLQHALKEGCKVPEVMFKSPTDTFGYIIYKMLPGTSLSLAYHTLSPAALDTVCTQIVENVSALSKVSYASFGSLVEADKKHRSWKLFLEDVIIDNKDYLAANAIVDQQTFDSIIKFMLDYVKDIKAPTPQLVWSDFNQDNIIVYNNQLSGFVDFEGVFVGDPILSLGYLFALEGDSEFYKMISSKINFIFPFKFVDVVFYSFIRLLRLSRYLKTTLPTGDERLPVLEYLKGLNESIKFVKQQYP